jgi:hypothetical protein
MPPALPRRGAEPIPAISIGFFSLSKQNTIFLPDFSGVWAKIASYKTILTE